MEFSGQMAVFRCARCDRRKEVRTSAPPPECGEYVPPTRQAFPDGSWINVGEGYTPHGPMADTGQRINLAPPFAAPSVRERARLAEVELAGPRDLDAVKYGSAPRGVVS